MKKIALVFALAVFVPSLLLAWLAVRSLSDQKIVFERQQTLLYQGACSSLVKDILDFMSDRQGEFSRLVETLLVNQDPLDVAVHFDEKIMSSWPLANVGFAVSLEGNVLSPPLLARSETKRFRLENDLFLSNQETVEVYWNSPKGVIPISKNDDAPTGRETHDAKDGSKEPGGKGAEKFRKVTPQKDSEPDTKQVSRVTSSEAEFRQLIGDGSEGVIGRFLQNRLKLLMWYRSPHNRNLVFGAQLNLPALVSDLANLLKVDGSLQSEICVAILDDNGKPAAKSNANFEADWKRPFVSAEIGEVLPHWEVAAYLINPAALSRAGRTLAFTLGLLVVLLLVAIVVGGGLIVADLRRQLMLARQKTDFVSNVSHELKTPLTSIRMFSELLAENRVTDESKRRSYLNIITTEVARLTRLINNVLDFARMERGEKQYQFRQSDLIHLLRDTIESYRPQLESAGFQLKCALPSVAMFIHADGDAIAQVLVNLLSNAEKYSSDRKEIEVTVSASNDSASKSATDPRRIGMPSQAENAGVVSTSSTGSGSMLKLKTNSIVEVKVLDRGMGVPAGCEEKIFEQFFRANDSLNSGIQGSGLGLTLARQVARAHGGDLTYQARERGGSCFALRLPLVADS